MRNGLCAFQSCGGKAHGKGTTKSRTRTLRCQLWRSSQPHLSSRLRGPTDELICPFIPRPPVPPRAPQAADTAAAAADAAPWPERLRPRRSSSALALPSAASSSGSAGPLRLPEVAGLPPEPEAAGPLLAVPHIPRGYRLPAARHSARPSPFGSSHCVAPFKTARSARSRASVAGALERI